jgi:hypothetical protein
MQRALKQDKRSSAVLIARHLTLKSLPVHGAQLLAQLYNETVQ